MEGWRGQKWGLAKYFWNGHEILENAETGSIKEENVAAALPLNSASEQLPHTAWLCVSSLGLHALPTGQGVHVDAQRLREPRSCCIC